MPPTAIPYPPFPQVRDLTPLDPGTMTDLAHRLPLTPQFVIPYAGLRRGRDRVFLAGTVEDPDAVVDEHWGTPGEPEVWGSDPEAAWRILSRIPGWYCVNGTAEAVRQLRPMLERELRLPGREMGDLFYVLDQAPVVRPTPAARRLTVPDLPLVANYSPPVWGNSYASLEELLATGIVAGVVGRGHLVAVAVESARNPRYADVGVHTLAEFRNRGYSAAAAAVVCSAIQAEGLTPIWSTGSGNRASQRVAEKLGFHRIEAGAYLVFDQLQRRGGYRPD